MSINSIIDIAIEKVLVCVNSGVRSLLENDNMLYRNISHKTPTYNEAVIIELRNWGCNNKYLPNEICMLIMYHLHHNIEDVTDAQLEYFNRTNAYALDTEVLNCIHYSNFVSTNAKPTQYQ